MAQVRLHGETVKWMAKFDDLDEIIVKQHLLNFTIRGYKFDICDSQNQKIMEAIEELVSERLSVSEKTLILAGSFLADIFCIDNGLLRWNYSNQQTGASYDIVFKNSKYNKSMYIPGRALVINQISPLF
ncbi:Hypothetical predicted protein [Mytilus galloprovincialis]|uniref:Uncharacterized protein n=1 Tax=Mytilus galloprovincialis TaxID=29158 RepID=A0A8B6EU66_MYTGA|nr:Hypothetical predicted protein [Mytilus galloprovincialis]